MDVISPFAHQRDDSLASPPADPNRALAVTATYLLSEDGRKASLLAGGDGRALQQLTIQVPATRLHLVHVDTEGVARLKLRPRYELGSDQQVVRTDAPPTYDTPPDLEALFREAARNHQLERTYYTERRAAYASKRDADRDRRADIAKAFLNDPTQRALVHPAPTPARCYIATEHDRVLFDVKTDDVPARDVPAEAHRRFRTDLRARRECNRQTRAAQLAVHEEKKRFIAEWIVAHGTPEQQSRQAEGVLPMEEAIEAITNHVFATEYVRYARDGAATLQAYLRQIPNYAGIVVTPSDLCVTSADAREATAAQWLIVKALRERFPEATVKLRVHQLSTSQTPQAPRLTTFSVLATMKVGPLTVRREFDVRSD